MKLVKTSLKSLSLSQLNLERNIFVRIDLITLAPSILANSDLVLTLPSETAKRMSKNYGFSISDLPIDLEKRQTKTRLPIPSCFLVNE